LKDYPAEITLKKGCFDAKLRSPTLSELVATAQKI